MNQKIEKIKTLKSQKDIYFYLLDLVKEMAENGKKNDSKKKLYYISAEFLIGKLLSNNLINLGIYDEVANAVKECGFTMAEIEEMEPEPSLGNGGLGRLAACFLDSIATLNLNGDGIGLNYHFGLFRQKFEDNLQKEEKNPWITEQSWLRKTEKHFVVPYDGFSLTSTLYDIDVIGYQNGTNKLHLFDIDSIDYSLVRKGIEFNKEKIEKNLTYPGQIRVTVIRERRAVGLAK